MVMLAILAAPLGILGLVGAVGCFFIIYKLETDEAYAKRFE